MPRRFFLYWLIFLNAKNQEDKSEIDADNQLVECFWFFEGCFLLFFWKIRKKSSEYLTSHFQDCIFANGNKRSILGDYLKNLKNNPWKTWQVGFQNCIFATGSKNECLFMFIRTFTDKYGQKPTLTDIALYLSIIFATLNKN